MFGALPPMIKVKNFLIVNKENLADAIVATGLLQEIVDGNTNLFNYVESISGITDYGVEFRIDVSRFSVLSFLYSAHIVTAQMGWVVGVTSELEGISRINVYNSKMELVAALNWFEWSLEGHRSNRIDIINGGFGRMGRTMANLASVIYGKDPKKAGYKALIEIMPDFDLVKFCGSGLEREKRSGFLRNIQRNLQRRNTLAASSTTLTSLDNLLTYLLDITVDFEANETLNMVCLLVSYLDKTVLIELPLGVLMPMQCEDQVSVELGILRKLNANRPLF